MLPDLEHLLERIEQKLDWGKSSGWQGRDFENLNELILEETGVSLSASTLRRIWGRVEYKHLPSSTTLDTLAKFAGFENWRQFQKKQSIQQPVQLPSTGIPIASKKIRKPWTKMVWIVVAMLAVGLVSIFAGKKSRRPVNPSDYQFSSNPLTRDIPNSVIFNYDATASPSDSVFIQQSWDQRTRTLISKDLHQHTAIYYEPGFYKAKLFVDTVLVKEHSLLIPTNGWLGLIEHRPVPVYLKSSEFINKDSLNVEVSVISQKNVPMQPMVPEVRFSNVGNFEPVPVDSLTFSADIKNKFHDGSGACQMSSIVLITDGNPIIIPLSVKGCASDLGLLSVDQFVSGKRADLSGFTADLERWSTVSCKSDSGKIRYYVNQKLAFECMVPKKPVQVLGMSFAFRAQVP